MEKTLELISLDDDELLGVVGGGHGGCGQNHCQPQCQPCFEVDICVKVCW